jgi:kynurenine formamidase
MLLDHFKLIDLTQPLTAKSPTWNGSCGFCLEIKKDYDKMFRVHQIKMHAGIGTHLDAPSHRFEGGRSIAEIPLEQLIAPTCVIDVSHKAHADYAISAEDVLEYETAHGLIPQGSLVIGFTGWSRFWNDPQKYRNVDPAGQMHFPAFSKQAAELLLQRKIAGIAIDTLSPDCLDHTYPVHEILLGANIIIIENIADCSSIPARGAYMIALPLMAESTESPLRVVALVPA